MFKHYLPLLFIFLNFSPVIQGQQIRMPHLVIYPLFLYALLFTMKKKDVFLLLTKELRTIILLFCLMIFWGSASAFWMKSIYRFNPIGFLSAVDSLAFPIATIFLVSYCIKDINISALKNLLLKCMSIYIFIMMINGLLVMVHVITGQFWWFKYFIDSSGDVTVASLSLELGRYTGIFAQPFEAGLAASLGIFFIVYRIKYLQTIRLFDIVGFFLVALVGILAVSKAFYLVCPVLLFFYCIHKNPKWIKHFSTLIFTALIGVVVLFPLIAQRWDGYGYLKSFTEFDSANYTETLAKYSAGRYEQASFFDTTAKQIIFSHPLSGFGISWRPAFGESFDNAYFQALIYGGIPYLVLYLLLLSEMLLIAYSYKMFSSLESSFLTFFTLYIILAGNGAPCFQQHKFILVFFTVFTILIHIMVRQKELCIVSFRTRNFIENHKQF